MQKFILAFIVVVAINSMAIGQIEKNTWMVGGTGNLGAFDPGITQTPLITFQIQPVVGYFIAKNLTFGLSPGLLLFSQRNSGSQYNLFVPAFSRYYFNVSERISLFPEVSGGIGYSTILNGEAFFNLNAAVGASFWLNNNVAFEPILEYRIYNPNPFNTWFNTDIFPSLKLGFQIYLNRGNKAG